MEWNDQQEMALAAIEEWHKDPEAKQWFYLAGLAGTGKTTLAKHISETISHEPAFMAYTGKAALVMRQNGCYNASTCHSYLYTVIEDKTTGELSFVKKDLEFTQDLIILDECSMIDDGMARDIIDTKIKILVLGDPGQLPPINGRGFFIQGEPDFMLTEIHRQAKDSPIIWIADKVRRGMSIDPGKYGNCEVISKNSFSRMVETDQVILGTNQLRAKINAKYRSHLNFTDSNIMAGEKIIGLKNDYKKGFYNGEMFNVKSISDKIKNDYSSMVIESQDQGNVLTVRYHTSMFNPEIPTPHWKALRGVSHFDFGYAITCHKSQGSQWDSVYVVNESDTFWDTKEKWLYTAVTRAKEKLILAL